MILDRLADATRARYARRMADTPLDIVKSRALALPKGNFAFERALGAPGVSLICEVKKASPSKGLISLDFPYLDIARDYAAAGAAAISCLTEPDYFLGDDRYLQEIAAAVPIPVLCVRTLPFMITRSTRPRCWAPRRCFADLCPAGHGHPAPLY